MKLNCPLPTSQESLSQNAQLPPPHVLTPLSSLCSSLNFTKYQKRQRGVILALPFKSLLGYGNGEKRGVPLEKRGVPKSLPKAKL